MNGTHNLKTMILALLSVLIISAAGAFYTVSVRDSMLERAVSDVLELTAQGSRAFDIYAEKNAEILRSLALAAGSESSDSFAEISGCLSPLGGSENDYFIIDMDSGNIFSNRNGDVMSAGEDTLAFFDSLGKSGICEPDISALTGRSVMCCYEKFFFADGRKGIIIDELLLSSVADRFSISFFDGAGFSHIVNSEGKILVRSSHKNSSRSVKNIFDAVDVTGSSGKELNGLREALEKRQKHSAVVSYRGKRYVYACVPIGSSSGWHIISVIPEEVIMRDAESIVKSTRTLIFVFCISIVFFASLMIIMRRGYKSVLEMEHELRSREQLFGTLSKSTNEVVLMSSADGSSVEYVSPNIERVMGIPAADVKKDIFVINGTLCSHENEMGSELMKKLVPGKPFSVENERIHAANGEHRWFSESFYLTEAEGKEKLISVFSDRTAEHSSKAALKGALDIAGEANNAKSAFLSRMSHDIRTPLNAVSGLAALLQRDCDKPERVREHTRKIEASCRHMLGLINDILDMSKIESGKAAINLSEIDLAEMTEELYTIIRPQAKARGQSFEISAVNVRREYLVGDRLRIEQILINLLSNAVKYTQNGGRIEMIMEQVPGGAENFVRMKFTVRDNGMGMSEDFMKIIFTPFAREANSAANKIQGTGLGMAITKNLVDLMGGTVSADSRLGEGSVFTVELELRVQEKDSGRDFLKSRGISRILAADGDAGVCADIARSMEESGASVRCAYDGQSAAELAREARGMGSDFDAVIIDRGLPGEGGIETARRIRREAPENTLIMLLASCDRVDIEEEARAAGIDGILTKPFFPGGFRREAERILSGDGSKETEEPSVENIRVLIAEDNEINAEILTELLSEIPGLTYTVAADGREAVDCFERSAAGEYGIILMDVRMPVMDGYEATKAIRASGRPDAETVPIVAMTANAFAEDVKAALDAGMNAHVSKPVDPDRIIEVLKEFTGGGSRTGQ